MKTLVNIFFILFFLSLCGLGGIADAQQKVGPEIVKVFTVYVQYDYDMPWQIMRQDRRTGSGCIIRGNKILTNAHVVADQTFIQVKRAGQAKKYTAEVEAVAHTCDLAVLKVNDLSFFSDTEPLELGSLARMGDKVAVYGFPAGGDELCITEGIVSRVEYRGYAHSNAHLLTCQIDAAINAGSSGGPVIKDGRIVGIAFQSLKSGDNVGYMVPVTLIDHFLQDIQDGTYDGIPSLELGWQAMENPDLRGKYQMGDSWSGVLVTHIPPGSPVEGRLRVRDVILSIDGRSIGNDGKIAFRESERIHFEHAVHSKFIHDEVTLKILREGKVLDTTIPLTIPIDFLALVPFRQFDRPPTYFILGGLVFQPLTGNYLDMWSRLERAPSHLVSQFHYGKRNKKRSQVIVLTNILGGEITAGYEEAQYLVISQVNGRPISSMGDLVSAFEKNIGPYHTIVGDHGERIVLERSKTKAKTEVLLKRYKIRSDRSDDLKADTMDK